MTHPHRILIEACIASVAGAVAAQRGGADRLEVNAALEVGGLTPSPGLFLAVREAVALPVIAMVRPRAGGFCYSEDEFAVMQRDAEWLMERGADGIAFGVLLANHEVDVARCRWMIEVVKPGEVVFHRAFDFTPDPLAAMEQLIDLGVTRILTSGQAATAAAGAGVLAQLQALARGRVEILRGAGVSAGSAADLLRRTGCRQVHGTFRRPLAAAREATIGASLEAAFGDARYDAAGTDEATVAAVRAVVDALPPLHS